MSNRNDRAAHDEAVAKMMLRAYSLATGAPMASIVRSCVIESLKRALAENPGVRERYEAARARLLKASKVVELSARRRIKRATAP